MQVDHEITTHLDTPNLTAVKVVAAIRRITVAQARIELLTEWDQWLATAIDAENNQAEMWVGMAADVARPIRTARWRSSTPLANAWPCPRGTSTSAPRQPT